MEKKTFSHLGWVESELGLNIGDVHRTQRRAVYALGALLRTAHANNGADLSTIEK